MPKTICDATNHSQSMRESSSGLTTLSVAHTNAVHISGASRLPQKAERLDGNIGSNTENRSPTSIEITPWENSATMKATPWKASNWATSARASEGITAAASRLIGYQMLP